MAKDDELFACLVSDEKTGDLLQMVTDATETQIKTDPSFKPQGSIQTLIPMALYKKLMILPAPPPEDAAADSK